MGGFRCLGLFPKKIDFFWMPSLILNFAFWTSHLFSSPDFALNENYWWKDNNEEQSHFPDCQQNKFLQVLGKQPNLSKLMIFFYCIKTVLIEIWYFCEVFIWYSSPCFGQPVLLKWRVASYLSLENLNQYLLWPWWFRISIVHSIVFWSELIFFTRLQDHIYIWNKLM